jgi:hypothetical protein
MEQVTGSQEKALDDNNPREALSGWRYHPRAAQVLLVVFVLSVAGVALIPKSWDAVRTMSFTVGIFCAGMMAARSAAIWQRIGR